MIELGDRVDPIALFVHRPGRRLLVASDRGRGFVVAENDVVAQTRSGKQVLNLDSGVPSPSTMLCMQTGRCDPTPSSVDASSSPSFTDF